MLELELTLALRAIGKIYCESLAIDRGTPDESLEYAAAWINNAVMIIGGEKIEVRVHPAMYQTPLYALLTRKYPQVIDIPADYYLTKPNIVFKPARRLDRNKSTSSYFLGTRIPRIPTTPTGIYAGVNIGQTGLKMLLIERDNIIPESKHYSLTWPDPQNKSVDDLISRIASFLRRLCEDAGFHIDQLSGIGVSIGGIVRDEKVTTRSGVSSNMSNEEFQRFSQIKRYLKDITGKPCFIEQDAISKAFAASIIHSLNSCLLIDIGTSTGGAYIDEKGNISGILGQLGRVVIDTSPTAVERPDGKGRGCLSQYLSLTGLVRLAGKYGLKIEDPIEIENQIGRSEAIGQLLDDFGDTLVAGLLACQDVVQFHSVMLTGGILAGQIGNYLVKLVGERSKEFQQLSAIRFAKSLEPQYDSCIGVALLARQKKTNNESS